MFLDLDVSLLPNEAYPFTVQALDEANTVLWSTKIEQRDKNDAGNVTVEVPRLENLACFRIRWATGEVERSDAGRGYDGSFEEGTTAAAVA